MRKTIFTVGLVLALLICAPASRAQNDKPEPMPHFYRLKLVVEELDGAGKIINNRSYSTDISTKKGSRDSSIRAQSRVPYIQDIKANGTKGTSYYEVGANFDVRDVIEVSGQLALSIQADISSYAFMEVLESNSEHTFQNPYIRRNQWEASPVIPINKPTVIFNSDAVDGKGSMQVVATVTPIP